MTTPDNGTPAAPVSGAPATPETPAAPLVPDSPEYNAAMIAKADGQVPNPAPNGPANADKPAEDLNNTPTDAPAPDTPKPEDTPKPDEAKPDDTQKPEDTPKDGDTPPTDVPDFAKMFEDGSFAQAFNAETVDPKFREGLAKALNVSGENVDAMISQYRAGQEALARESVGKLHTAAGGKENFEAAVAWGMKNLSDDQKQWYDAQFNGPNAADAVALLMQKAGAARDPNLAIPNGGAGTPGLQPFKDQSQLVAAMADPRYRDSPAYRAEVEARLRLS